MMMLHGKGVAPGAAVGHVFIYNKNYDIPAESFILSGQEQAHLNRYFSVKKQALEELEKIKVSMLKVDSAKAAIFDAQKEIVEDIIINEEIPARILNERWSGAWAVYQVYETVLNVLRNTPDPLISERAADFDDVRALLLKIWYGQKTEGLSNLPEPVIVAARELLPSDTAGLKRDKVLAIITEAGGITSHTAIIAKSFGIPAVLGIEGLLNSIKQGQLVAVNAEEGTVIVDPKDDVKKEFLEKSGVFNRERQETEGFLEKEGRTACGTKIEISLNISSSNDEELKMQSFTDSVGLLRTEFLYMEHNKLPPEDEQFYSYKKILECFNEKPVVLRTLDIGGDKQVPYLDFKREDNPFLGNRGIRFCFSNRDILKTQIRAALRASVYGNLWILLPMITSLDDIRNAKKIIKEAGNELKKEGIKFNDVKTGIMIEVPGIAHIADLAAQEVDFASIGSNDLCQYLCAADRMNETVESYYQCYHPAVFRLIKTAISAFNDAGKSISICGELGNDVKAVPVLIGLGLRKFSMGAASIAAVKKTISGLTIEKAQETALHVLGLPTAEEIEKYLELI
ncbi:MAG: phosphoenolpyruvate--protein phosphotransferase [Treponema sp.]|nr:phosphoenolpyruvate--protein phosphotransferase [Treponema sp.]